MSVEEYSSSVSVLSSSSVEAPLGALAAALGALLLLGRTGAGATAVVGDDGGGRLGDRLGEAFSNLGERLGDAGVVVVRGDAGCLGDRRGEACGVVVRDDHRGDAADRAGEAPADRNDFRRKSFKFSLDPISALSPLLLLTSASLSYSFVVVCVWCLGGGCRHLRL